MWRRFAKVTQKELKDKYTSKAKLAGYRSAAAHKLIDLNQRYNIMHPGQTVIDVGAAPGGWTQVAIESVQSTAKLPRVLAIDIQSMDPLPGATILSLDVSKLECVDQILPHWSSPADVLLSDLSGNITGDRDLDCSIMQHSNLDSLKIAKKLVKPGGTILMRMLTFLKSLFSELQRVKSSIAASDALEVYYLGKGWLLGEKQKTAPGVSVAQLKTMAKMAKASGVEVDRDVEDMMKSVIGTVDGKTDEFNFLKDDDATLEELEKQMQGKLSFNFPVPNNMQELEALYQKMSKEAPKAKEEDADEEKDAEDEDEEKTGKGTEDESKIMSEKEEAERLVQNVANQSSDYDEKMSKEEMDEGLAAMKELDEEMEQPDMPDSSENQIREKRVKGEYDEWSKVLKDRDIWNKK